VSIPFSWHWIDCPQCGAKKGAPCSTDPIGLFGWCKARVDATGHEEER
jgi:hypothetical protein